MSKTHYGRDCRVVNIEGNFYIYTYEKKSNQQTNENEYQQPSVLLHLDVDL